MSLAVAATGILSYTGTDATDGTIVTVGTVVYTLKTGALSAAGHVAIVAGNPDATARNLAYAINGAGGVPGTDYFAIGANGAAKAQHDPVGDIILVTAKQAGSAGNTVALTSNEPEFTVPGTLAGGIDGTGVPAWSLVSLDEVKLALRVRGDSADEELASLTGEATSYIETFLQFRPVADDGTLDPEEDLDEYHDLANPQGFIYLRRRPIRTITTVYIQTTALSSSDYIFDSKSGMITLVGGLVTRPVGGILGGSVHQPLAGPFVNWPEDIWRFGTRSFPAGQSSARVLYKGGYAETSTVDPALKSIALDVVARIYRVRERKSQGVSSEIAAGLSLATKYDPKILSEDLKARLRPYVTLTKTARE